MNSAGLADQDMNCYERAEGDEYSRRLRNF